MKIQNRIASYLPEALRPEAGPDGTELPDVKELIGKAERLIREHPGPALGAAFVLGVVIAWWIKRT